MPKTKISEFSATPGNNTDIDGINIAEGCAPSGINDAIRELMAQLKDFQAGTAGDSFNGPVGTTTAAAGAFTTLSSTGNTTLGDAAGDTVTVNGTATFANANPTLSAGTANGVAYLNGSKVLTTGSALVFDGSNLGLGVTPSAWGTGYKAFQIGDSALSNYGNGYAFLSQNVLFGTSTNTYINSAAASYYRQYTGAHAWFTAPSGTAGNTITFTQAMTLDANNVLYVNGTSQIAGSILNVRGNGSYIGVGGSTVQMLFGDNNSLNGFLGTLTNHDLTIRTNNTERVRITSSGDLLVGTTVTPSSSSSGCSIEDGAMRTSFGSYTGAGDHIFFINGNGTVGRISSNGTTTTYNTSSDYRLKENIQPMTGALAKVAQLKPCTYKWKADGSDGEGFIAHELAEVVPQCVTGEKDAVDAEGNPVYQGIDTSFLVATLTAALQELNAKVEAQAAEIAALKGQA